MKMTMHPTARLTPLALALLVLAGCASAPPPAPVTTPKNRFSGTLADLENREIDIKTEQVVPQSAEEVLANYQTALKLFRDPAARLDTLKRMADLTMESSQSRDDERASAEAAQHKQYMQGLENKSAAGTLQKPGEQQRNLEVNYGEAVQLYLAVLKNAQTPEERTDAYYNLAKAYDLNGQRAESVDTLRQLIAQYPDSPLTVEARFRIAEYEFTNGKYLSAADNYALVVKADKSGDFRDQALYKQGWALYKASDYEQAQPVFFQVLEELQGKMRSPDPKVRANAQRLREDTFNIVCLGFIQQDGARSVEQYFKKVGPKSYETDVYMSLGKTYLGKRQYRNAADTYEFFVAKYPFNARAPEFSSATIKAFQDGGFPSEVLPAKEKFVQRYNQKSEFWAKADENTRLNLVPLLQSHVIDLAKYWHASAQQSQKEDDYLKAAKWYREYLALNPSQIDAITINQLLAEALFAAKHFDEAITEFEKTAYDYPRNPKASDAAYFALLAYNEQEKLGVKGTPQEQKAWWDRRTASTLKFAKSFPADKNTPILLQGLTNDQLARKDLPGAMKTAGVLLQLQPPAPSTMQKEAWAVVANGEYDLGRPEAAEIAFGKVLAFNDLTPDERHTYQEKLIASVYKQAEKLKAAGDVDGAVGAYQRAARGTTDPKLKSAAEFDAAATYMTAERYAAAIPLLVAFRAAYPTSTLNATIPEKLALAYEKTGQNDKAAGEYELIAAANTTANPDLAREALWSAGDLYGKAGRTDDSVRILRHYVAAYPKPVDVQMEGFNRLYTNANKQGNAAESQSWLKELSSAYDRAGAANTARTSYLGAMAKYQLNRPLYDDFAAIPLNQPLKKSLAVKKVAMQKALDAYAKTAAIGVAEFTTASNYQIAEIYRKLAADLIASERPKGLSDLELEQYGFLLEEQATPFEDKALDLYIANANLAKQNIYDDAVRKSFAALAKLSPGRYNKHEQPEPFVDVIY
ncbi:MAG TPA: tetratricopeptide repeat protein [Moraxellaceae bacterium]|nr:tetratricopeptide repeat protein [Moraxellaceae bacterium]